MTKSRSDDSSPFRHEIARLLGGGVYIGHAFGCPYPSRGGACSCLPPSRGFDYDTLTARLAEGYWEDDDEGGNE